MAKRDSQVRDLTLGESDDDNRQAAQAERDFIKFYREQAGVDLPKLLQQSRRRRTWLYVTSGLVVLLGLAFGGYYIFNHSGGGKFGEEAVALSLAGPASVPSGQTVEYTLTYANNQGVDLNQVEVNLRYPAGFTVQTVLPQADKPDGTSVALGTIAAHQTGTVVIRGQLVGEVSDKKDFSALVTYQPTNFNAHFTKAATMSTDIVASVLNLEVSAPQQLPADQPLSLNITYHSSATSKLTGLLLKFTAPGGFQLDVPQLPAWNGTTDTWTLPDLDPKAQGQVALTGKFTDAAQSGPQNFLVAVGLVGPDGATFAAQEEKSVVVNLIKSHLTVQLTANDMSVQSTADLGQELDYQIDFANEGDIPFTNVTLVGQFDTTYLDWSSLKDPNNGTPDRAKGTITWGPNTLPLLQSLGSGNRGSLRFSFNLNASLPAGVTQGPSFTAQVTAQGQSQVGGANQPVSSQSNQLVTKVNTQFTLEAEGRYYTNDLVKLGSGPLPPKVGQTTTYVIFWRLGNSFNEVDTVEVTTTLPQGVEWTGQTTVTAGQKVTYNPNTREVRWDLNRLPAGAGASFTKPEASFEVALTPQSSDVNKILVLTKTATATSHDTFSGADLIATAKLITTELDNDAAAQGKGTVVP